MPRSVERAHRRRAVSRSRNARELSQHLLTDPAVARRLVAAARLPPDLPVVEPGAGLGAVTAVLAPGRDVTVYEIDPGFARALRARFAGSGVRVVGGDFLAAHAPRRPFAVVGNIPYAVTGGIVRWCLAAPSLRSATLITQWEYARARTGGYGRWTRLTAATWPVVTWRLCGRVPRAVFRPAPRVDGGILRIARRPAPLLTGEALAGYRDMVHLAFTGVGGGVRASLARRYGRTRVAAALRAADLPPGVLVGEVPPDAWLAVFAHLEGVRPDGGREGRRRR
ncbi:MAG TPA: 23S ribosomal RNA methyltransferase Erm [Streptosporangiaceae bacterium]|jgi:23S rRNA (adenine-N6)-dimethyltransferase